MAKRLLVLAVLCVFTALSQDSRASITGTVTDPSGAVIPNALVKAIKQGTNEARETVTNHQGLYTLPYLDPGRYTVEAQSAGFTTLSRTDIVLNVADKLNLSLELKVGQVADTLTVVGDQELIMTTNASRGLVFDEIKVQEYPLNGRQSYMLMALTPGVLFTQQQFGSSGFSGTRGWDVNGSYTMNGGRTGTNQFLLNGAPISTDGTWQIAPNVEAIQEFKVMTNTYDAQYGRSGGGHVNTTIKSGSNGLHGTLFDFWRNTVFDANNTQNNRQGAPRGKRNQHQFGGTVGGAIRKDKDFIFLSFEGWREVVPFPVVQNIPPAAQRNGDGYTVFNQKIHDPLTSRLCVSGRDVANCVSGGQFIRDPFPGNRIPASRISPIGKKILDLYPLPNQVGAATLSQNWFASSEVGRYRYEQPMGRYDKVIGEKDRIYGMFYWQDGSEFRNSSGLPRPAMNGNMDSVRQQYGSVLDWTRMVSPTAVLDIRLSHARFWQNFPEVSDPDFTWDKLGIKNIPLVPTNPSREAPRVELQDFREILGGGKITNFSSRDQLNISPSMSQQIGRHSLKYGFEGALITRATNDEDRSTGLIRFERSWTQQYSGRSQGNLDGSSVASVLLGTTHSGRVNYNDSFLRREPYTAWYIQDDFKVNTRLTLNLGLRYDIQWPLREHLNRLNAGFDIDAKNPYSDEVLANWRTIKAQWDPTHASSPYPNPPAELRGGLTFAGVKGQPEKVFNADYTNIQPRIGVAYRFLDKTVLRTGFGIFHRTVNDGNTTTGFNQETPFIRSLDGGITPSACQGGNCLTGAYSLENPWPSGLVTPLGAAGGLTTNIGRGVSFDDRNRPIPRTYQYSFGFEQELPGAMVIEVSYVGSRTYQERVRRAGGDGIQIGDIPYDVRLQAIASPNFYNEPLPNPYLGILPSNSDWGAPTTINRNNLLRQIPLFNGVRNNTFIGGSVWYNALQVRFEKRAFSDRRAGALTWVVSYTFAKQMERLLRNDWNVPQEKFVSQITDIDRPQQFSFSGVWDLPLGKGRKFNIENRVLNGILGNWNYNWTLTYYSGTPTGKPDAVFSCGSYVVNDRTLTRWFENRKECYIQRPPYSFREVEERFGNIRNPTAPQLNMAVAKRFRMGENYEMEFRGESFNTTNTPIYAPPPTDFNGNDFGRVPIQQYNFPRQVQLALRFRF